MSAVSHRFFNRVRYVKNIVGVVSVFGKMEILGKNPQFPVFFLFIKQRAISIAQSDATS